jgi:hypothetical protein
MASMAAMVAWACAERVGRIAAVMVSAALLLLPLSVEQSLAFGLDAPVAMAMLFSGMAFWRFLENGSNASLLGFTFAATVGLLTKGNALALYLFVPLALILTRRFDVLRNWRVWTAATVVSFVAIPWYVYSYRLASQGFRAKWGIDFTASALTSNIIFLVSTCGPVILVFAAWGALKTLRSRDSNLGAVCLALALSVYIFQSIVPASLNARYLFVMVPCLLVIAAIGTRDLFSNFSGGHRALAVGILIALAVSLATLQYPPAKVYRGVGGSVQVVLRELPENNPAVMIVGMDVVETAFISQVAMSRPIDPKIWIVRGSRLLGGGGYNNFEYEPRFRTTEEALSEMEKFRIPLIVISTYGRIASWAHIRQVQEVIDRPGSGWRLASRSDGSEDVRVYVNDKYAEMSCATQLIRELSLPKRKEVTG